METIRIERLLFGALLSVGLLGGAMKISLMTCDVGPGVGDIALMCSGVLMFFGGVGGMGLLCLTLFGPASIDRAQFWAFLAGIFGAAVLFLKQ